MNSNGQLIGVSFTRNENYILKIPRIYLELSESIVMEDTWELLDLQDDCIPSGKDKLFSGLSLVEVNFWENGKIVRSENFPYEV